MSGARRIATHKKRVQWILAAGIGLSLLLTGVVSPAFGLQPSQGPDPKVAEATEDRLPMDITGDADFSVERDRLQEVLRPLLEYDGGTTWNPDSQILTIQMTSEAAFDKAREMLATSKTTLQIRFRRVQYSANELNELSNQLLDNQVQWAGATGIGGGYDPVSNRILLQVDGGYEDAPALIRAIENLGDARVRLQIIESIEGWGPESSSLAN